MYADALIILCLLQQSPPHFYDVNNHHLLVIKLSAPLWNVNNIFRLEVLVCSDIYGFA